MKTLTAFGQTLTLSQWMSSPLCADGITTRILMDRLKRMAPEDALTSPTTKQHDISVEAGYFYYGYPLSYISRDAKDLLKRYRGAVILPPSLSFPYWLSEDKLTNIHYRKGKFYLVKLSKDLILKEYSSHKNYKVAIDFLMSE